MLEGRRKAKAGCAPVAFGHASFVRCWGDSARSPGAEPIGGAADALASQPADQRLTHLVSPDSTL